MLQFRCLCIHNLVLIPLGQVNILYGRSQREFFVSSLTTWCRTLLNDKKLLFKLDVILAEKMLIR